MTDRYTTTTRAVAAGLSAAARQTPHRASSQLMTRQ